ncbi:MAG: phosphonopyruvate decarboxylase [Methanoculleus sp.]|jgi:phosphonopyruvate decarboxylase
MFSPKRIFDTIKDQGISFFTGVPDSLLKDFCAYVTDHVEERVHVIAANEGNAIALAAGWFMASGESALVYMQNSGLGNAINPLISLADPEVYSIPMLIMIGWRGEPGQPDEPQHSKQGRILTELLDVLELPWFVLDGSLEEPELVVVQACQVLRERMMPVVLVVKSGFFSHYSLQKGNATQCCISREDAMKIIVDLLEPGDLVVSTTGKLSRELYEYREAQGDGHGSDFLTVGSMGHASSIAMGIAARRLDQRVICFDGDGATIMHMGALAMIGQSGLNNLIHIVFNNGAHDSVGGQPTVGLDIDIPLIAKACGYREACSVAEPDDIKKSLNHLQFTDGPAFLEVRVKKGSRKDLGRPKNSPLENRNAFMANLGITRAEDSNA